MTTKGEGGEFPTADISAPEQVRVVGRPFRKGVSGNPGGRKKLLREVEKMLDAEHRNIENVREGFNVLRKLAFQGITNDVFYEGAVCGQKTEFSAAFMELYWNRVLGPVKRSEVIEELAAMMRAATDQEIDVLIAIKRRLAT